MSARSTTTDRDRARGSTEASGWLVCSALLLFATWAQADDHVVASPRKTFEIVQHWTGSNFTQTLRFNGDPSRLITLEEGIEWSGDYHISADDRWILRIQKTGSGDNIALLYNLDDRGRLWRNEEQVGELGFTYLSKLPGLPRNLYHTGIEFVSWDLAAGLLHFTIHGSDLDQSGRYIDDLPLVYRLGDGTVTAP